MPEPLTSQDWLSILTAIRQLHDTARILDRLPADQQGLSPAALDAEAGRLADLMAAQCDSGPHRRELERLQAMMRRR